MATTLQDIVSNYTKPIDYSPISQGIEQGINNGIRLQDLAAKRQQFGAEMAYKQQEYQRQVNEGSFNKYIDALKLDNPQERDLALSAADEYRSNLRLPTMNEGLKDVLHKSDDARAKAIQLASGLSPTMPDPNNPGKQVLDPGYTQKIAQAVASFTGPGKGSAANAMKLINEASQHQTSMAQSQLLGNAKMGVAQLGADKDIWKYAANNGDAMILASGNVGNPEYQNALGRANAIRSQRVAEDQQAKVNNVNAGTDLKQAQTKAIPQRLELMKKRLAQQGMSLNQKDQDRLEKLDEKLVGNKVYSSLQDAQSTMDRDYDLLKDRMSWQDVAAVHKSLTRALTGSARPAFGAEQSMNFHDYSKFFTDQFGKVTGEEQGGPSADQVAKLKTRFNTIRQGISNASVNFEQKYWNTKTSQKLTTPEMAKAFFEANNPGSVYTPSATHVASGTTAPQAKNAAPQKAPQGIDVSTERQKAGAVIQQLMKDPKSIPGLTVDMIKNKFKTKTGQDF